MIPTPTRAQRKNDEQSTANQVINALITLMSLNEPGILYHNTEASALRDIPVMAMCNPDAMLSVDQALTFNPPPPTSLT